MIYALIIVVIAIIGLLMMGAVLLQSGKGGGLAGIASGGATTQLLGSRQAPDFLEKATWVLATAFIVLCVLSNFFVGVGEVPDSVLQEQTEQAPIQSPIVPPQPSGQESGEAPGDGQ